MDCCGTIYSCTWHGPCPHELESAMAACTNPYKIKPVTIPAWGREGLWRPPDTYLRSYWQLMAGKSFHNFIPRVWSLVRCPCSSRGPYIQAPTDRTKWSQWVILKIKNKRGQEVGQRIRRSGTFEELGGIWLLSKCILYMYGVLNENIKNILKAKLSLCPYLILFLDIELMSSFYPQSLTIKWGSENILKNNIESKLQASIP